MLGPFVVSLKFRGETLKLQKPFCENVIFAALHNLSGPNPVIIVTIAEKQNKVKYKILAHVCNFIGDNISIKSSNINCHQQCL